MAKVQQLEKKMRRELFVRIGHYLSEKRIASQLKQADIAKISGYSSQFISNIECGMAFPPAKLMSTMIESYDIKEDEFLDKVMEYQLEFYREVYFKHRDVRKSFTSGRSASR